MFQTFISYSWNFAPVFVFVQVSESSDAVKVPFTLLPEAQNEGQFAFTVDSVNMPQKLKGTLTYMVKVRAAFLNQSTCFPFRPF